jgi:hypothetical protein
MLVLLPTCQKDIRQLQNLLRWMKKLGPLKSHCALICCDAATDAGEVLEAQKIAVDLFGESRVISNNAPVMGWPDGPWSLFTTATAYIEAEWPQPFLIVEPDAIPLDRGGLMRSERIPAACVRREGQP